MGEGGGAALATARGDTLQTGTPALNLAAVRVGATEASRGLVMLHGIYGRGRNWQGIARAVTSARPEYACWLVDLPYHGESGAGTHGDTVVGLAADVDAWLTAQGIVADAVLGHSYGGKVALAMAAPRRAQPLQIWIIDSTPEPKPPSGSAWTMLALIRRLPSRFATRQAAISALTEGGYTLDMAQWMATNLARDDAGFVWRLDFAAMERLLLDFFSTDLWSSVEASSTHHDLHFVKASESSAMSGQTVARIEAAANERLHLHHRPGGHWIHAESPEIISELLISSLR